MPKDELIEVYCPECDFLYVLSVRSLHEKPELYCRFCDKTFPIHIHDRLRWREPTGKLKALIQRQSDK